MALEYDGQPIETIQSNAQLLDVVRGVGLKMPSGQFFRGLTSTMTAPASAPQRITYDVVQKLFEAPQGTPVGHVRNATIYFLASLLVGPLTAPKNWREETIKATQQDINCLREFAVSKKLEPFQIRREDEARWILELLKDQHGKLAIEYLGGNGILTFVSRDQVRITV